MKNEIKVLKSQNRKMKRVLKFALEELGKPRD